MAILTRQQVSDDLLRPDLLDTTAFSDTYLNGVIAAVEGSMGSYLHWNPCLQTYTDEQGVAQFVQGGTYAGRYLVELRNQPLVPGDAPAIFTKFQLKYPMTVPMAADVALNFVKVENETGQVFCLAPGAVEALVGTYFGYAPVMQRVTAVGYVASYSAGYATGNGTDPNDPTTNLPFTSVPALPSQFKDAALLLVRERLMVDSALNKNLSNPNAALLYRVRVGEREEAYRNFARGTVQGTLGLGTPLSESAEMLLAPYKKRRLPYFL